MEGIEEEWGAAVGKWAEMRGQAAWQEKRMVELTELITERVTELNSLRIETEAEKQKIYEEVQKKLEGEHQQWIQKQEQSHNFINFYQL